MYGEEDLKAIRAGAEQPLPEENPPSVLCEMRIIFFQAPVLLLMAMSSKLISLLNAIGLRAIASLIHVTSHHSCKELRDLIIRQQFLVPARNYPKVAAFDVYMCPSVPVSSIRDPRVRQRTQIQIAIYSWRIKSYQSAFLMKILSTSLKRGYFLQASIVSLKVAACFSQTIIGGFLEMDCGYIDDQRDFREEFKRWKKTYPWALDGESSAVEFCKLIDSIHAAFPTPSSLEMYSQKGACKGMSEYFIHLFFTSRNNCKDPKKRAKLVAEQFRDGASGQAIVMQVFNDLLTTWFPYTRFLVGSSSISADELDKRDLSGVEKVEKLKPGVYFVHITDLHCLVYIKLKDGTSYMWDPNKGLIEYGAAQLLDYIIEDYHTESPGSDIHFYRYKQFRWLRSNCGGI